MSSVLDTHRKILSFHNITAVEILLVKFSKKLYHINSHVCKCDNVQ